MLPVSSRLLTVTGEPATVNFKNMYKLSQLYPAKRAFITGAASGLGKALCHELAKDGWTIGVSDINDDALVETHNEILKLGGKPISYHLDVSNRDEYLQVSQKFLNDADFFCISDNYWLGAKKPCLTYGLRGLAYFSVSLQCCEQDLHSGVLGGTVHEAMTGE